MFMNIWQNSLNQLQLTIIHGFDNKSAIVAEKEEASACSRRFSSLKDLISIHVGVQRELNLFKVDPIHVTEPLKKTCWISGNGRPFNLERLIGLRLITFWLIHVFSLLHFYSFVLWFSNLLSNYFLFVQEAFRKIKLDMLRFFVFF